jgi:Uma2 family endonuclease
MGRPGPAHRYAARGIIRRFDGMRDSADWWFEVEAEIRLPEDLLVIPDIAGWRVAHVPPAFIRENPIRQVPAWCCELLSPRTARDDRQIKLPLYVRSGVSWIWLVDPDARVVEVQVHEARAGSPALALKAEGDETCILPPFDADFAIGGWWLPTKAAT